MNKDNYPNCPRCKENVNVVRLTMGYRCAFCGTRIYEEGERGQQKLI